MGQGGASNVAVVELTCTGFVAGGAGLARGEDGRIVFVRGALPGERVRVEITERRKDFARAEVREVLVASPDRVAPTCPHVADGCGGCDWQHVAASAQPAHKAAIVADALHRLARIPDALVIAGEPGPSVGHRTSIRVAVQYGRAGYRKASSHERVVVRSCLVAHPQLESLLVGGEWGSATEVTLRIGAATGDRLALVAPHAAGVVLPSDAADVIVVGVDEIGAGRAVHLHEVVGGVRFRISATSFFQTQHAGAEALVRAVDAAVGDAEVLLDLYGGVGLFAATVGPRFDTVVSVERHGASALDAAHNLQGRSNAVSIAADVERWRPDAALSARRSRVVIADPARAGLGRRGVDAVLGCDARSVVLVSCDAAALGRDAGLLVAGGYRLVESRLIDVFAHTAHVEVVSRFDRTDS